MIQGKWSLTLNLYRFDWTYKYNLFCKLFLMENKKQ